MEETKVIIRRHGQVKRLDVELSAWQYHRLDALTTRLGMTKAEAIAHALNIWFHEIEMMIEKAKGS